MAAKYASGKKASVRQAACNMVVGSTLYILEEGGESFMVAGKRAWRVNFVVTVSHSEKFEDFSEVVARRPQHHMDEAEISRLCKKQGP